MRFLALAFSGCLAFGLVPNLKASECSEPGESLGVSRILPVEVGEGPMGRLNYRQTLKLRPKEVVLTFDDGPIPTKTPAVLEALRAQCVKATFFVVGQMVANSPEILRQISADHHTIGTHTWSHRYLNRLKSGAEDQISGGLAAAARALEGDQSALSPFFRFPGLGRTKRLERFLQANSMMPFSVDVVGDDWRPISSQEVLRRILLRLEANQGGILLLHDIQARTVAMLPTLLAELKARGFRIVHIVPKLAETQTALANMSLPNNRKMLATLAKIPVNPQVQRAQIAETNAMVLAVLDPATLGLRGSIDTNLLDH